jgi:hypothetical protein
MVYMKAGRTLFISYLSSLLQALGGETVAVFPVFKAGSLPEAAVVSSAAYGKEYASAKDERLVVHRRGQRRRTEEEGVEESVTGLSSPSSPPPGTCPSGMRTNGTFSSSTTSAPRVAAP